MSDSMSSPARTSIRWRSQPWSINRALLTIILLPLLTTMTLTGWQSLRLLESHASSRMQDEIALIGRALRFPLSQALIHQRPEGLQWVLEAAFDFDQVYGIYVYGEQGQLVASAGASQVSVPSERASGLALLGLRGGEFLDTSPDAVFSYFVPLTDAGERIVGMLQITRRASDFDHYLGQVRRQTGFFIVGTGVAIALIFIGGYRWVIGRHLASINDGLGKIEAGNLDHRIVPQGPREFHQLTSALNGMLDSIAQSHEALRAQQARETALVQRLHQSEKLAALGHFAAGIAHQLGSPLSTIGGQAQRAQRHQDLPERVVRALGVVRQEVARMERLIKQLLDYARARPPERRSIAMDLPLQGALAQLNADPDSPPRSVRTEGPRPAPSLLADPVRLEQALHNLLDNALQAGRGSTVSVRWVHDGDRLCYEIEDAGPGVPEAIRARIFDPFFTTKASGEGTGMGLALVETVAREHGGSITVDRSEALGGARFRLCLPVADEAKR
ncbi:HAMP domain-containing sensor histidine kinase [Thioalkalicoccus limnaeus]|uniref:histidine kinase n=1 Tax=Thioalkalicoccus limnaeus TaxID=120681 RepID=A0ABV4BFG4_9GAMM